MIGIDTNVMIRYIVQDDPEQSRQAEAFIENSCTRENPGFVCNIVLAEIAWVLDRGYGYDKAVILTILRQILGTAELRLEDPATAWSALEDYERGMAGFADCLLGRINRANGCETTYTFDKKAGKLATFHPMSASP